MKSKINKLLLTSIASFLVLASCGASGPNVMSHEVPDENNTNAMVQESSEEIVEPIESTTYSEVKPNTNSESSPDPHSQVEPEETSIAQETSIPDPTPGFYQVSVSLYVKIDLINTTFVIKPLTKEELPFQYLESEYFSNTSIYFILEKNLIYSYFGNNKELKDKVEDYFDNITEDFALNSLKNEYIDIEVGVWKENFDVCYSVSRSLKVKEIIYHTVSYYNDGSTLLYEETVRDGYKAHYPYDNPTSELTDLFETSTFNGWEDYIDVASYDEEIVSDVEFVATYDYYYVPHTVKYYAEDRTTLLEEKEANSPNEVAFTKTLPTKEADLENDIQYSFKEWVVIALDDNSVSYAATFESYTRGLVFEDNTIKAYVGTKKDVFTPTKINGVVIDTVGPQCFETRNIDSIILSDSITKISDKAFYNVSSLKEITFGNNLEVIGQEAFLGCSSLKEIILPNTLEYAGLNAFKGCSSIKDITIPCSLYDSPLNNTTTSFCDIFDTEDHKYNEVNIISNSIDSITEGYLNAASINSLNILEGVKVIGSRAFQYVYGLENLYIGNDVTNIGTNAALNSSIKSLIIVGDDLEIGACAFQGCTNLKDVNLGNTKTIGGSAFSGCIRLVNFEGDQFETIGNNSFYNCSSLLRFDVPDTTVSIGKNAFDSCYKLREISLGDNLESIGNSAFSNCSNLSIVYIYSDLQDIGTGAFSNCSNLSYIFSVNELKPVHYSAGWYGNAQPIWGYQRTETDDDYIYYYASEYDYKKVYMLNKDYSEISEDVDLPRFKDGYEIIRLTNPHATYITNLIRDNEYISVSGGSGGHCMNPTSINYSSLLTDLPESKLPKANKYSNNGYQYSFNACLVSGVGLYYRLYINALGKEYNSNDFVTAISKIEGWSVVWMDDYYLAYYEGKDIYITFKDNQEGMIYIEYYGQMGDLPEEYTPIQGGEAVVDGENEEDTPVDQIIQFQLNANQDGYIATRLLDDSITTLEIPSTYNDLPVIAIGDRFTGLKYHNRSYAKIIIPSSVKSIGEYAFYLFEASEIELNEGLEEIGDYAFGNNLVLSSINIPSSVTTMGKNPFMYCQRLSTITFNNGSDYFTSSDYVLFTKDMKKLITYAPFKSGQYTVPSTVEVIGDSAFADIRTKHSVVLPTSIKTIETSAFNFNNCIQSITYLGTKSQFNKINLESGWNSLCYLPSVTCSDGNVIINS